MRRCLWILCVKIISTRRQGHLTFTRGRMPRNCHLWRHLWMGDCMWAFHTRPGYGRSATLRHLNWTSRTVIRVRSIQLQTQGTFLESVMCILSAVFFYDSYFVVTMCTPQGGRAACDTVCANQRAKSSRVHLCSRVSNRGAWY